VLLAGAVVASCGIAALALLPHGASAAALVLCALVAGAGLPPIGSCVRVLLPVVLPDPDRRHAAFSLDSALVEVGYVAGPALIAGALGAWSTAAACAACVVLLAIGIGAFVAHPAAAARGRREAHDPGGLLGPLRSRGVRVLVGVLALVGAGFGAIEVGIPAVTADAGSPHQAGLLLGLWGVGSMTGGFVAARRRAPRDPAARARVLLLVLALADAPLALAAHPVALALLLPLSGIAIAPMFACVFGLLDRISPAGTVTEAYGWITSGITAGLACGSALAGQLAERITPGAALAVAALASAAAALLAWVRRDALG
jgi:predicted MFS family arabinose efflux permease